MHRIAATTRIALALALCGVSVGAHAEHSATLEVDRSEVPQAPDSDVLVASRDALAGIRSDSDGEKPARPAKIKKRARAAANVDLSRFSNGPRWVPAPRGRALVRATELGIGTHEATVKLLRSGPSAELRAAVPGEQPRTLLWPVPGGHPGRGFGFTRRVRAELRHNGIDIGGESGTTVRAAEAGLVVYSDNTLKGYGNAVIVLHAGGLMTLYAHNLRNTVQPGWYVERGERIALLGATGYAWGPHLHFELRDGFRPRDPAPMIRGFHSDEVAGPLAELTSPEAAVAPQPAAAPKPKPVAAPTPVAEDAGSPVGRTFRTLLFPLKGGQPTRTFQARTHAAIALTAPIGAGVRAAADGVISYSGPALPRHGDAKLAQSIVLDHADGTSSTYTAPLSDGLPSGTRVLRGQWLGRLASSSAAPTLRFTYQRDGKAVDPTALLVGQ